MPARWSQRGENENKNNFLAGPGTPESKKDLGSATGAVNETSQQEVQSANAGGSAINFLDGVRVEINVAEVSKRVSATFDDASTAVRNSLVNLGHS